MTRDLEQINRDITDPMMACHDQPILPHVSSGDCLVAQR